MKSGTEITIIYTDLSDFVELWICATNGVFSGETRLYAGPEALPNLQLNCISSCPRGRNRFNRIVNAA